MEGRTPAQVQSMFLTFATEMGKSVGTESGEWRLDYDKSLGGYMILERLPSGRSYMPITSFRHEADAFEDMLYFAIESLRIKAKEYS